MTTDTRPIEEVWVAEQIERIRRAVLDDPQNPLSSNERLLLTALLTYLNLKEGVADPGMVKLAKETGFSKPRIRQLLTGLIERGIVTVDSSCGTSGMTRYKFTSAAVPASLKRS
jgi:hypothetical protein